MNQSTPSKEDRNCIGHVLRGESLFTMEGNITGKQKTDQGGCYWTRR